MQEVKHALEFHRKVKEFAANEEWLNEKWLMKEVVI
jgi:hypothetical protein